MNIRNIDSHTVELVLNLDDSTLPADQMPARPVSGAERAGALRAEREAAYRQMHRLMQDISSLRAREMRFAMSRQAVIADMMFRLALAAEMRKGSGVEDVVRIGVMSALLANEMGWSPDQCDAIQLAAPLRDLGWAALPDYWQVIDSSEPSERRRLAAHCALGKQLLDDSGDPAMEMAAAIASSHHERHDGHGYPLHLAGEAIPPAARIVGCIDVFNTLIEGGGEIPTLSPEEAMDQILRSDAWFHPDVLAALGRIRELLLAIHTVLDPSMLNDEVRAAIRSQWRPGFWRCFLG